MSFEKALLENDIEQLRAFDKVDLHNHAPLSCTKKFLAQNGYKLPSSKDIKDFASFNQWIEVLKPLLRDEKGLATLLRGNFKNCTETGVVAVAPSVPYRGVLRTFGNDITAFIAFLRKLSEQYDNLNILWDLGIAREKYKVEDNSIINQLIESGLFNGIDLYGEEISAPNEQFADFFKKANELGMTTKVHTGEQLGADSIKKSILELNPSHIQHGIRIIEDENAVALAKERNITFNICPTSNVKLGIVKSFKKHPIKKMYDKGLSVTIGTDDLLAFDSDINNEYMQLHKNGVLSATELNEIRENGLRSI